MDEYCNTSLTSHPQCLILNDGTDLKLFSKSETKISNKLDNKSMEYVHKLKIRRFVKRNQRHQ